MRRFTSLDPMFFAAYLATIKDRIQTEPTLRAYTQQRKTEDTEAAKWATDSRQQRRARERELKKMRK